MTRGNLNEKNDVAHSACCFSPQRSTDRVELCHTSDIMTCNIIATCRTTEVSIYCYSVKFWPQSLYGADKEAVLREKLLDHRDMYYRDGLIFVKKEIQVVASHIQFLSFLLLVLSSCKSNLFYLFVNADFGLSNFIEMQCKEESTAGDCFIQRENHGGRRLHEGEQIKRLMCC